LLRATGEQRCHTEEWHPVPVLFALCWPGIAIVVTAQRSFQVKYALMGISFFLLVWVGTFVLML